MIGLVWVYLEVRMICWKSLCLVLVTNSGVQEEKGFLYDIGLGCYISEYLEISQLEAWLIVVLVDGRNPARLLRMIESLFQNRTYRLFLPIKSTGGTRHFFEFYIIDLM